MDGGIAHGSEVADIQLDAKLEQIQPALALLVRPVKVHSFLITSMGMFWLVSGVMSIRWGLSGRRARGLPLLAGIVGVMAGLAAISRRFQPLDAVTSDTLAITVLGVAILLTGLMHMLGGFRTGEDATRQLSRLSLILGLFEVVLGAALIVAAWLLTGVYVQWANHRYDAEIARLNAQGGVQ